MPAHLLCEGRNLPYRKAPWGRRSSKRRKAGTLSGRRGNSGPDILGKEENAVRLKKKAQMEEKDSAKTSPSTHRGPFIQEGVERNRKKEDGRAQKRPDRSSQTEGGKN